MSIVITNQQNQAIKAVSAWFKSFSPEFGTGTHFSLEGFAGSGKSTILPYIIDACGLNQSQVAFCAPTGKAAKVMTSKLGGEVASTVHSLIYTPRAMKTDQLLQQVQQLASTLEGAIRDGNLTDREMETLILQLDVAKKELNRSFDQPDDLRFTLNMDSRVVRSRLIVCDESSMINEEMAADIKMFGVPVLALGDSAQIQPIEGSRGLLRDAPDFFLSEIHRQALENPIIAVATMAREGKRIKLGTYGDTVRVIEYKDDDVTTNTDSNAMILVGTNRKRWKLIKRIRKAFDCLAPYPMEGEPLIVCKNFRRNDALLYTNGEFVTCLEDHSHMTEGQAYFTIRFEDEHGNAQRELAYQGLFESHKFKHPNKTTAPKEAAYKSRMKHLNVDWGLAITVHKSQGSQWDEVVVHDESAVFRDQANNHLYTAITRAVEKLTIVL